MNASDQFYFWYFFFHGIGHTWACRSKFIIGAFSPNKSLVDAIDVISIAMKSIVTKFMSGVEINQQRASDANGKPKYIDERKELLSF